MRRPGASLGRALDKEIYQAVCKFIDSSPDQQTNPHHLSVQDVYAGLKRSNSSLNRKSKVLLEDSIERILGVLREDYGAPDSLEDEEDALDREAELLEEKKRNDASTAMNRSLIKGWALSNEVRTSTSPSNANDNLNGEASTPKQKKRPAPASEKATSESARPQKPSKRPKADSKLTSSPPSHVSLADLGGMDDTIAKFQELLLLPLMRPERYLRRGLKIPRGILLHGPPGCGKTMLCEAVAAELDLPFLSISAPSIVSGMSGESEKALRNHFEHATSLAPAIMFIDEIDAITPKRESAQREMERRIVGQLLTCLDDLALEKTGGKPVIVLAATNRPDSLDPALRRGGRFDTEINIGVPTAAVREQILRAQTRKTEIAPDVDFAKLAHMTPGYVGADLESLIYRAGSASNARYLDALRALSKQHQSSSDAEPLSNHQSGPQMSLDDGVDVDMADAATTAAATSSTEDALAATSSSSKLSPAVDQFRALRTLLDDSQDPPSLSVADAITMSDFLTALPTMQPSSQREGFATIPDTNWSSIGALSHVRHQLHAAIVAPIQAPEKYRRFNITPAAGVLLWGPPGCGKTLLAKAVANESKANFISVKGPELLNKYVGESERAVRQLFFRAKHSQPCVVFFDELDALVPRRSDTNSEASSRVVNTLLTELDGVAARSGIYVIAATNRPEMIDRAMLRPGRLGKHLFVGLPGAEERVEIFETLLRKMPLRDEEGERARLLHFARGCDGFSGADLSNLAYEAAQCAVERDGEFLELGDLEQARKEVKPSVGNVKEYENMSLGGGL